MESTEVETCIMRIKSYPILKNWPYPYFTNRFNVLIVVVRGFCALVPFHITFFVTGSDVNRLFVLLPNPFPWWKVLTNYHSLATSGRNFQHDHFFWEMCTGSEVTVGCFLPNRKNINNPIEKVCSIQRNHTSYKSSALYVFLLNSDWLA